MIGIFLHRANLIVIGLGKAPIQLAPGTPLGTPQGSGSSFATSSTYFPSITEFLIVIGILSLSALLFAWSPLPAAEGEGQGVTVGDEEGRHGRAALCGAAVFRALALGFGEPDEALAAALAGGELADELRAAVAGLGLWDDVCRGGAGGRTPGRRAREEAAG